MKKIILFIIEVVLYFALPLYIIFLKFGHLQSNYLKIGFLGIVLIVFLLLIFKRFYVDNVIDDIRGQITNFKSDYKTETNAERKAKIKSEMAKSKTLIALYNAITPIIILAVAWVAAIAMEAQFIKLSDSVKYILLCYIVGAVISLYRVSGASIIAFFKHIFRR